MKESIIRILEVLVSINILILISPLIIIVIILTKIKNKRILFKQDRVGYMGNYFKIYKFVTMKDNSHIKGTITFYNEPRILNFGRILIKFKINEIPQLLNIIKGDMSFIGPRPLTEECFKCYDNMTKNTIIKVKPGLTGIGSIVFINEELFLKNNDIIFNRKFYHNIIMPLKSELEKWYISNRNIYLDIKLFIYTLIIIAFPKSHVYLNIYSVKKIISKSKAYSILLNV